MARVGIFWVFFGYECEETNLFSFSFNARWLRKLVPSSGLGVFMPANLRMTNATDKGPLPLLAGIF
jgi:hypothetical protein